MRNSCYNSINTPVRIMCYGLFHGGAMDLESFELDEGALAEAAKRREQKLADDEQSIARPDDNDCGGSCSI